MRNVYDFDGTIYVGDSTVDFYIFCIRRHPLSLLPLPMVAFYILGYKLHLCSKTRLKEVFYCFLRHVPQIDKELFSFWATHEKKLQPWYLLKRRDADIIVSASPEFLLAPICNKLHTHLIASRVDRLTGKTTGENCRGEEKVRRLFEQYPNIKIREFYSDSRSDLPLARLAKQSFFVTKRGNEPWKR